MTRPAQLLFAVLVVAAFAAFFVAQRLKHGSTVVQRFHRTALISPNGDGRRDVAYITFALKQTDDVSVEIVDASGEPLRRLLARRRLRAHRLLPRLRWDGRDDAGRVVRDGRYRVRVILRDEGRSIVLPRAIRVIGPARPRARPPPRRRVAAIGPASFELSG